MANTIKGNPFKAGDIVYYLDESPRDPFYVYDVYSPTEVSLTLREYPDTEQDDLTDISKIAKITGAKLVAAKKKLKRMME